MLHPRFKHTSPQKQNGYAISAKRPVWINSVTNSKFDKKEQKKKGNKKERCEITNLPQQAILSSDFNLIQLVQ